MSKPGPSAAAIYGSLNSFEGALTDKKRIEDIEKLERAITAIRADEAAKVRASTIEECARVAENVVCPPAKDSIDEAICAGALQCSTQISAAIRSLGEKS